jgi:hypothetical protein
MIDVVHGVEISPSTIAARLVQTGGVDTGDEATGGYLVDHVGRRTLLTFLEPLQEGESSDSSTVRELRGLRRLISALHGRFSRKVLQPLMDTQCGVRALVRGSRSPLVHAEAVLVLKEAIRAGLRLRPVWLPREMVEIRIADGLGKEDEQVRRQQDLQLDPAVFRERGVGPAVHRSVRGRGQRTAAALLQPALHGGLRGRRRLRARLEQGVRVG